MSAKAKRARRKIATLNEKPLHAALKRWYARPTDRLEMLVDGFQVDLVRGDLLVEIQTRNFASIRKKLSALALRHRLRLVYPIARRKWIVRLAEDGEGQLGRRRSPKRGTLEEVFEELVYLPGLLANPNFSVEVLFIHEEEVRRYDAGRGWRRHHWVTQERRLLDVVDRRLFETPGDMCALIPQAVADRFTTADLADATGRPRWLAQKMAYCLRQMGAIEPVGKHRNSILYVRAAA